MRFATVDNGTPDGQLVIVSQDGARLLEIGEQAPNLLAVMEDWNGAMSELEPAAERLMDGEGRSAETLRAPMPRSWQWLDGSAFDTHGKLMQIAFGLDPIETDRPLMYQGMSDRFYGPNDDIPFPAEEDGIDFEGEFGVIVDEVPMGISASEAMQHIRLVVQINDWSLRTIAPIEMKTGFGWVQAKPACSMAPFAVTPDELGDGWREGRVCLDLDVEWNGQPFGSANGREMDFGFHELIAHAARTRNLVAGTIIGSGTVSNAAYATVGSSCISERRAIEMIEKGAFATEFMRFGDQIRMAGRAVDGSTPFGVLEQRVVAA